MKRRYAVREESWISRPSSDRWSPEERGVDLDVHVAGDRARDRATVAREHRAPLEGFLVHVRDVGAEDDPAALDRPSLLSAVRVDLDGDIDPIRYEAGLGELIAHGHRVARGVRGREELLGRRLAFGCLRPGTPRDGLVVEDAARRGGHASPAV